MALPLMQLVRDDSDPESRRLRQERREEACEGREDSLFSKARNSRRSSKNVLFSVEEAITRMLQS